MAYEYESKETRVLKTIDSQRYPDTNKDFVKNIRRLNSSVDYMSSYMRVMQKGIDDANKNFIEKIQSFINDLVVLFAGGEPTGIEIGDLKYIIQALGALFGFSNEPFPVNLFHAARNFFDNFLSQLVQFTDVIFDAIEAWMLVLIEKLGDVPIIGDTITRIANKIIDITNKAQQGIDDAANAYARGSLGVSKADTATVDAANAQNTANYATTQITILMSGMLASDVAGGIVVSEQFAGPSSNDLGGSFTLTRSDGPGAGDFGLDGSGHAVWKKSGAAWRRKVYRHNTKMATDYHSAHTIISKMPDETPWGSDDALDYLFVRMSDDGTEGVWLVICRSGIEIGYAGSGGFTGVYSLSIPVSVGDQFSFIAGTDAGGINNFQVKQNSQVKTGTNIDFPYGSGYRSVGVGAKATSGAFFQQVGPGQLEMFAANDRKPETI